MKLTYFGHSCFQLTFEKNTLLIDPFITGNKFAEKIITPADLNPSILVLTHAHGDHFGDTPQLLEQSNPLFIGTFEVATYVNNKFGHENYHPMNTGGNASFDWGKIKLTYARHSSSFPDGTYGGTANGVLLEIDGKKIYHAGDTDLFAEMEWLADEKIDVALLPVGDNFTMGIDDSIRAASMIQATTVVPTHYNTFPYIEIDIDAWEKKMTANKLGCEVMSAGEILTF